MTWHRGQNRLRCHHCGAETRLPERCPGCGKPKLLPVGRGTERLEDGLRDPFPEARIARLDRDTTRRKGILHTTLEQVRDGDIDILIGTQMLAKGHHFPGVTLVGILDADGGLFSTDFRAGERMAQLLVQVAGRAGRGAHPGRVLIQTHHPEHPLLQALRHGDYPEFARTALLERSDTRLPPYSYLALLRAEATDRALPLSFLSAAFQAACRPPDIDLQGPVPAPMERRAGRYRAQLLVQSHARPALHQFLNAWLPALEGLPGARKVRWSIDVDPQEML